MPNRIQNRLITGGRRMTWGASASANANMSQVMVSLLILRSSMEVVLIKAHLHTRPGPPGSDAGVRPHARSGFADRAGAGHSGNLPPQYQGPNGITGRDVAPYQVRAGYPNQDRKSTRLNSSHGYISY